MTQQHAQQATLNNLVMFYQDMQAHSLSQLATLYHQDILLVDPVGQHHGRDAVTGYFAALLKNLRYCRFDITHQHAFDEAALLLWRMDYAHPALQKGAPQSLEGSSYLTFRDSRVIFQRDYYDLGEMLYEKVPVLGSAIRALKRRLKS
ncbi:nuclear transport factor 2 family protein [Winslowiella iniecta]|uniref:Transcriptional regulator n=1 Tax=Winslowiella iniecta TaxID=1560201 RepID=A0A0L7TBW2_9GAMM|nr:nuclear transport factor 2 family protein [Winslowiella iniecta]KOC92847.1 transcriptional regulator [Winslowiella iniecta]KOC95234.1 transcriptional regulator [Winslowiella iniecta]